MTQLFLEGEIPTSVIHQILTLKILLIFTKKCTAKPYSFLVLDATLRSDNPWRFGKNLLERIWKLIMTSDYKIRDEKLQYDISKEAAKISALSSRKLTNMNIFHVKKS